MKDSIRLGAALFPEKLHFTSFSKLWLARKQKGNRNVINNQEGIIPSPKFTNEIIPASKGCFCSPLNLLHSFQSALFWSADATNSLESFVEIYLISFMRIDSRLKIRLIYVKCGKAQTSTTFQFINIVINDDFLGWNLRWNKQKFKLL